MVVYFSSEQRIDFRNLVHDIGQVLHTRVEMRQVGVRDEAKFLGGYGRCGRPLCCASWLREFAPVSIKMAKTQDLPLEHLRGLGRVRPAALPPELRKRLLHRRRANVCRRSTA